MNRYGDQARRHWQRWLPGPYAAIGETDTFFMLLGDMIAAGIDELAGELAGDDPPGDGYLGKVARLAAARGTPNSGNGSACRW